MTTPPQGQAQAQRPTATSFIELRARSRAQALLDQGTFHELLGPFERLESPWLEMQDIIPESDDGVIVARGRLAGEEAVILAIEGAFQGGAIGEVAGEKFISSLELAKQDCERGTPVRPVLLLETGGVRLQEGLLGEAAMARIHANIVALRAHVPVVGIISGMIGCFGGMSITAGLCSYLISTREGRLGLNGPAVVEEEAGIAEFDSHDPPLIWSIMGGTQREGSGFVDLLVDDDIEVIRQALLAVFARGKPGHYRSAQVQAYRSLLATFDLTNQLDPEVAHVLLKSGREV
ncbi:biotin-independent malonate decarboxylase subunit beta [Ktedonospora formicarum]|uniref:Biotin-independent malonate decarboxylase subunit beta n=1 Tax=Ktedonospora formicarum TaxID=2778364 RepID=A0A8J3MZP3_9CHLR|nr:biotin-independent malonate decarboxylase subunit beta [Ktedonospora formicarum]GHO50990.1 biotin-independent malonate decarboxylase subunit beta [Ktedonospora formicarum]